MADFTDEFNEHSDALREARKQDDFDNLQHTYSGVETGQQTRHGLTKDTSGSVTGGKRKSVTERIRETLDWLLLNDPQYRLAHENLMSAVRGAQQVTQSAFERVMSTLSEERSVMNKLLSNAAKLPDGTAVFRDKDGNVRGEDGEIIPPELTATIEWRGSEPSYEDYIAQKTRIEELENAESELRGIETELGEIDERANTNTAPRTPEELGSDTNRTNALKERAEEIEAKTFDHAPDRGTDSISKPEIEADSDISELVKKPTITIGGKP